MSELHHDTEGLYAVEAGFRLSFERELEDQPVACHAR